MLFTSRRRSYGFAAMSLLVVASLLAACGGANNQASSATTAAATAAGTTAAAKPLKVAFFNAVATNTFTKAAVDGIEAMAKKVNAEVIAFDAKFDATVQANQMQDAVATGKFDIFIVIPINNAGLVPVAQEAVKAGITVVSILSTIGTNLDTLKSSVDGVITIGQTFTANGTDIADQVVKACGTLSPCKVAYMPADAKQATEKIRSDAVLAGLAKVSAIEVVSTQPGGFDAGSGLTAAQNIITAHPDIDVMAASAGQAISGAIQAIGQAGLTGKVKVVSNGATIEDITGIRDGSIFASPVFLPRTEGSMAMELGAKAHRGEKVPTEVDELTYSPIGRVADTASLSTEKGKAFVGEYSSH